jgi:membrane protein YqaA with SNARE-associated domain
MNPHLMEAGFLSGLTEWLEGFAASPAASLWLFAFAFAESSFFPIPPDALLIALCLTDASLSSFAVTMWFAGLCTVASTIGGAFGFVLGKYAGRPILNKLASQERIAAVETLLQNYDVWAVAGAGFTPIPYKIFTIASGMLNVRFVRFMVASVLSRGARFFIVAILCYAVGAPVKTLIMNNLEWASVAFFALLVGGFVLVKYVASRYKGASDGAKEQ